MAASVALRNVPAAHAAGICTTLPVGQLKPAAQSMHAVAPAASWYVPSPHAVQSWLLALAANVPALHSVAEVAPAKQKLPAGQAWHSCWPPSPLALPKLPAAHGRSTPLPSSQWEPAAHSKHAVWPAEFWYLPAVHLAHELCSA